MPKREKFNAPTFEIPLSLQANTVRGVEERGCI